VNAKENRKYRRWRTAVILKIDIIWRYLSEKSSDFDEVLHTAADFKLDERHVIKNEKSCIGQTPSSTEGISCYVTKIIMTSLASVPWNWNSTDGSRPL